MVLSSVLLWVPPAMQLEAVRQLQCGINSAGSLQVMGEIAPRKEQGRQVGVFPSMGRSWGSPGKGLGAYLGVLGREKDNWPMGLSPEDLTVVGIKR